MTNEEAIFQLKSNIDPEIRRQAAEELSASNSLDSNYIEAFAEGLLDPDYGVRDVCAIFLLNIPEHLMNESALKVAPFLAHSEIELRNLAREIIEKIGNPAVEALLSYIDEEDPQLVQVACEILGKIGDETIMPYVLKLLSHNDSNVVISAIDSIGKLKSEKSLYRLIEMYDLNDDLKPFIISSIGEIGGDESQSFLIEKSKEEKDLFLKTACIEALAHSGSDVSICIDLLNELQHSSKEMQKLMLKTIFAISNRNSILIELPYELRYIAHNALLDDDIDFRLAGLLALGDTYYIEDVRSIINEVQKNNQETQELILFNLLNNAPTDIISEFISALFLQDDAENSIISIISCLPGFWKNSPEESKDKIIEAMIYELLSNNSYSKEIYDILCLLDFDRLYNYLKNYIIFGLGEYVNNAREILYNLSEDGKRTVISS